MNESRKQELEFMVRNEIPVPVTETRSLVEFECGLYDDHYTIQELIEAGLLSYVGMRGKYFYARGLRRFLMYVDAAREVSPGEFLMLRIGADGRRELEAWSEE